MAFLAERLRWVTPKDRNSFYGRITAGLVGVVVALSSLQDIEIYNERIIAIAYHEERWVEDLTDTEREERSKAITAFFIMTPPDAWNSPKTLQREREEALQTMQRFRERQIAYVNLYAHSPYDGSETAKRNILIKGALSGILLLLGSRAITRRWRGHLETIP